MLFSNTCSGLSIFHLLFPSLKLLLFPPAVRSRRSTLTCSLHLNHTAKHARSRTASAARSHTRSLALLLSCLPPHSHIYTHTHTHIYTHTHTHPFHKVLAAAVLAEATIAALKEEEASETRCSRVNERVASQRRPPLLWNYRGTKEEDHYSASAIAVFLPSPPSRFFRPPLARGVVFDGG